MNAVTLPRAAVLKLLHQAQLGDGAGFIVRQPDGALGIRPIAAAQPRAELERELKASGEAAFAFYRTAAQTGPDARDVQRWNGFAPLFLSVSVGIKGVLQLRGWQASGGRTDPVELSLAEEGPDQKSGVSR
ncbi:MAG TPA: hypothetical protein VGT99_08025 [Gammaproteobacteria bacterium]|nr:hypothetical protein [Gammaproteobacteria bacterium]